MFHRTMSMLITLGVSALFIRGGNWPAAVLFVIVVIMTYALIGAQVTQTIDKLRIIELEGRVDRMKTDHEKAMTDQILKTYDMAMGEMDHREAAREQGH